MIKRISIFLFIAVAHSLGCFLLYGQARSIPHVIANEWTLFLVLPAIAFALYFMTFRSSQFLQSKTWRNPALFTLSFLAAFLSEWVGVVFAFNTYGT
jgi:hypothetical protein